MHQMLEHQADRIEAVLTQHKIPASVTGGTVTPHRIRFQVVPGAYIASITGLAGELAAALGVPAVRLEWQDGAVIVEVPRDDPIPVRLLPLLRGLRNIPPATAVLGIADDGVPLLVHLPAPEIAHILVAGASGSGKTALLRAIIFSLAYLNRSSSVAFVLVDLKGDAFRAFGGLPQLVRPVISDPAEAVEALESLARLMEQRNLRDESNPPVVVFIDELTDLMMADSVEAERCLTRLIQRGQKANIHIIAATQRPTAAIIGNLVRTNFPVRIVGRMTNAEDALVASGREGTGAEWLLGRGDFIAVADGQLHRFQAAYIAPEEIRQLITNHHHREVHDGESGKGRQGGMGGPEG